MTSAFNQSIGTAARAAAAQNTTRELRAFIRRIEKNTAVARQQTPIRRALMRLNYALGHPRRFYHAWRQARDGVRRYGDAVYRRYGISPADQFVHLFTDVARYGTDAGEFYQCRLYLPDRRAERHWHILRSESFWLQLHLNQSLHPADYKALRDKVLFSLRCRDHALPTPAILATFARGVMTSEPAPLPAGDLFSKPATGWGGGGARLWPAANADTDGLVARLCELSKEPDSVLLLQRRLTNHPALLPLTNGFLSTLRLVTCKSPTGAIELLPPVIRMPHGDRIVDNFAKGGLVAPIDAASGIISGPAVKKDASLGTIFVERHPDSGATLQGFQVPFWDQARALAERGHRAFPTMFSVGWDVAILPDGPILLEGNSICDTNVTVLPHGITLSDTAFVACCMPLLRTAMGN